MTINNDDDWSAAVLDGMVASFGSRLMALTIDVVLLCFFMVLLLVFTGNNLVELPGAAYSFGHFFYVFGNLCISLLFGLVVTSMCYFCLMHAWCEQTIGKNIMGIRLVSGAGDELNVGTSFLRWAGYFVSALPFFFGFCWALLDVEGRTWHDRLAGTKVVYG